MGSRCNQSLVLSMQGTDNQDLPEQQQAHRNQNHCADDLADRWMRSGAADSGLEAPEDSSVFDGSLTVSV